MRGDENGKEAKGRTEGEKGRKDKKSQKKKKKKKKDKKRRKREGKPLAISSPSSQSPMILFFCVCVVCRKRKGGEGEKVKKGEWKGRGDRKEGFKQPLDEWPDFSFFSFFSSLSLSFFQKARLFFLWVASASPGTRIEFEFPLLGREETWVLTRSLSRVECCIFLIQSKKKKRKRKKKRKEKKRRRERERLE
jgi:hypothetical protein